MQPSVLTMFPSLQVNGKLTGYLLEALSSQIAVQDDFPNEAKVQVHPTSSPVLHPDRHCCPSLLPSSQFSAWASLLDALVLSTTIPSPHIVVHTEGVPAVEAAAVQAHPVSKVQVELHPSLFEMFPSSHASPESAIPFPQVAVQTEGTAEEV